MLVEERRLSPVVETDEHPVYEVPVVEDIEGAEGPVPSVFACV